MTNRVCVHQGSALVVKYPTCHILTILTIWYGTLSWRRAFKVSNWQSRSVHTCIRRLSFSRHNGPLTLHTTGEIGSTHTREKSQIWRHKKSLTTSFSQRANNESFLTDEINKRSFSLTKIISHYKTKIQVYITYSTHYCMN